MTTTYALSPLFKITRLDQEGRVVLHAGSGDERGHFAVDGAGAQPLIAWLLGVSPTGETALVDGVASAAGMDLEAGRAFVRSMIEAKVLVPEGSHSDAQQRIAEWSRFGWRDAADFHLATHGLRFIPDEVDGVSNEEYFSQMVDDVESAGEQPPAAAPRAGSHVGEAFAGPVTRRSSLDDVLAVAEPINRFDGARVRGQEFMPALRQAFGVQRTARPTVKAVGSFAAPQRAARLTAATRLNSWPCTGGCRLCQRRWVKHAVPAIRSRPRPDIYYCTSTGGVLPGRALVVVTGQPRPSPETPQKHRFYHSITRLGVRGFGPTVPGVTE